MIYFISDLHLGANTKILNNNFIQFCESLIKLQKSIEKKITIYILGDLFDLWLGDDIINPNLEPVINALKNLAKNMIQVYFIAGNRDFLIGEQFARITKCTILKDPHLLEVNNKKILLSHGDLFCTNDKIYQIYRSFVQSKIIKKLFLFLPKPVRKKIAHKLRAISTTENHKKYKKNKSLFKINIDKIIAYLDKYNAKTMIHGHIHQEIIKDLKSSHKKDNYKYIVLPDWHITQAKALLYTSNNHHFSFRLVC